MVIQRSLHFDLDLFAQSKLPEPTLPVFVDDEMIYFNKAIRETLFAESDGVWD